MKKCCVSSERINDGLTFIEDTLKSYHYKGKQLVDGLEICKTELDLLKQYADDNEEIKIRIRRWYSIVSIELSAKGAAFPFKDQKIVLSDQDLNQRNQNAMQSLLKTINADNISYVHQDQYNCIQIYLGDKERIFAWRTLFALLLATIFSAGALLFLPENTIAQCIEYVLNPIQTLFLNLLQLVTAPAVFFSIMTAVAKFASFTDLERIGKKTIFGYLISAFLAVLTGIFLFQVFRPTAEFTGLLNFMVQSGGKNSSILETMLKSVPNNIVSPFLNVDALQLLIVAFLCGIALAVAGKKSNILKDGAESLHQFFSTLVDIVTDLIPIAVFFVTSLLIFMFGLNVLVTTLRLFAVVVLGFCLLIILSLLAVAVFGKLNPIPFIRKMLPYMGQVFWSGSSVGKSSDTMRLCEEKLGISSKVYAFAIPFGAIANLDGNCLYMTIVGLFLTQLCGVNILGQDFITVAFMVMVLSIGSAITPGSAMLALTMMMGQMGVSIKIICIILGVNALLELFLAMSNNIREVASALIIARQEGLLDEKKYYISE